MVGKTILHYKIIEEIGRGGMGVVYKAMDTKLNRIVAIKFLPENIINSINDRKRFEIEAQSAASLNHPNIATIHSIEETSNSLFIVMEYIDGQELKTIIRKDDLGEIKDKPDLDKLISYVLDIAAGLKNAHDKNIVHRDIKSSNIMVTTDDQIKIMDFGLAKIENAPELTMVGTTVGTSFYMAPELIRGQIADKRSDIWSLGIIIYEMLTGSLPFSGAYEQAIFYAILNEEHTPATLKSNFKIPKVLEFILDKCLQKNPDDRFQDLQELIDYLKEKSSSKTVINTGSNPSGLKNKILPVVIGLSLVVIILSVYQFITSVLEQPASPQKHITILPLNFFGNDTTNNALCEGLQETLTSRLTQLEQYHSALWVVPSAEVRRQNIKSASEARVAFGANMAISGSLQIIGELFRLNLNLIDAENLRQLNSKVLDVNRSEIATLQEKAAAAVLNMIGLDNIKKEIPVNANLTTLPGAYEFYLQGVGYLNRYEDIRNIQTAITLFEKSVNIDTVFAIGYAGLGEAYWRMYEIGKDFNWVNLAIKNCERAYDLAPDVADINVRLAIVYTGIGELEKAVDHYEKAIEKEPANGLAYRGLAKAYAKQSKMDQAEKAYKKAIEIKTDYWGGYNDLGVFYFNQGRYAQAINQFKQVINLTPDNTRGYNNLGGIYYMTKRWPEAKEMFKKSLDLNKNYRACSNLGTLYYIEQNYSEAAHMYEIAVELNATDHRIWGNLASAYYLSEKNPEKAERTYKKAIALAEEIKTFNPNDANVIASLAGYYSMIDQREKAFAYMDMAIELAGDDPNIMYSVGTTYEHLGIREQAIDWLIKAIEAGYSKDEIENQPELVSLLSDLRFKTRIKNIVNNN